MMRQESMKKNVLEISFLEYEVNEIRSAALLPGEDEELSSRYKILANANAISEGLQAVYQYTGNDVSCAGDNVSRALKQLIKIVEYDEAIQSFRSDNCN